MPRGVGGDVYSYESVHAGQFQSAGFLSIDPARGNVSPQGLIPFNLRHANRRIGPFQRMM